MIASSSLSLKIVKCFSNQHPIYIPCYHLWSSRTTNQRPMSVLPYVFSSKVDVGQFEVLLLLVAGYIYPLLPFINATQSCLKKKEEVAIACRKKDSNQKLSTTRTCVVLWRCRKEKIERDSICCEIGAVFSGVCEAAHNVGSFLSAF
jgi:hypothetical protein